jgi:ATP-dependent Clp protease adaptor protein ClpS
MAHPLGQSPTLSSQPACTPVRATESEARSGFCPQYRVLVHNDPVTTMDFVVGVLVQVFGRSVEQAVEIMFAAHTSDVALVVVLPLEQAELRIEQAHSLARARHFPLTFTCEPE